MKVAIIVPVLNRPERVELVMENVADAIDLVDEARLLFVVNDDDEAELAALDAACAPYLRVPAIRRSWAMKINDGFRATTAEWIFTGADDLRFHEGWFTRALAWATPTTRVIGTNDICNHRVMTGQHSTHTLFRRDYVDELGTIDERGLVMHEGYGHDYADDEAIQTAMARGVYAHAFDAIVEHLHPMNGKAVEDSTYALGRAQSRMGRRLLQARRVLWADERKVRAAMVPPPERVVVVTATYGGYDAVLRAPVEQDVPTEYVCYTDDPSRVAAEQPWQVRYRPPIHENPRLAAKEMKCTPDPDVLGCSDVIWVDASHEIISPTFVREALASRVDGVAAFKHPRRDCAYTELDALLGAENQGGLYFSRPLEEQRAAYLAEGLPRRNGFYACGTVAWDLRSEKARAFGAAWLDETERRSHQDQVEFAAVAWRMKLTPGTFPVPQLDPRLSRGQPYLSGPWLRIHPHQTREEVPTPPVSVLIPFGGDDAARLAALDRVTAWWRYELPDAEVIVEHGDPLDWSKGDVTAKARTVASHDVLIIADADCLPDAAAVRACLAAVACGNVRWAVPHHRVARLSRQLTQRVLRGSAPNARELERPVHAAPLGGGCVVLTREAYESVNGIDPRFRGWGGEDISFGWALETLCGRPYKHASVLYHLWHPSATSRQRRGSPETEALAGRYRLSRGDPAAMRELVAEAKTGAGV